MNPINQTDNLPQVQNNMMPSQQEFQMLQVIAKNAQDSGLYAGMGQQAKIFMVLLAARELGVSPMLALNGGIWNIQGKIEISARLMNGLIRRAGHSIKIIVSNDTHCTLLGKRSDGDSFETSFNMDDAIKAGLAGGNVWKKYPADMLYNRCMSRLARRLFPDVIGNAYVENEIRESLAVEKLEQVDCEEIKPSVSYIKDQNMYSSPKIDTNMDHLEPDTNMDQLAKEEPKISEEELKEFLTSYANTDDVFKVNFEKYIFDKWNTVDFKNFLKKDFHLIMGWINKNLEMQAMAVNNANN